MRLKQSLCLDEKGVVSIIGAGGKTSLMFLLAHELADSGHKVLTTTTTKIYKPTRRESPVTIISRDPDIITKQARLLLKDNFHISAGADHELSEKKVIGLEPAAIERILQADLFDYILIEADGAAHRSLKACAHNEPVVPACTDIIVSLVGLDVLGKPLEERWVFRSDLFSSITGLPLGRPVTEESIALILLHDSAKITTNKKSVQRVAFLNKADDARLIDSGKRLATAIEKRNKQIFQRIIIAALREDPTILHCKVIGR